MPGNAVVGVRVQLDGLAAKEMCRAVTQSRNRGARSRATVNPRSAPAGWLASGVNLARQCVGGGGRDCGWRRLCAGRE